MGTVFQRQLLLFRNTFLTIHSHSITTLTLPFHHKTTFFPSVSFQSLLHIPTLTTSQLFQIQSLLITSSFFRNPFLSRTLLSRASTLCDVVYTLSVFRYVNSFDTFCVNTLIQAYSHSHVPHKAILFYFHSLQNHFFPNSYTFVPLIASCSKMGCIQSGKKCHAQAVKKGVHSVLPVQNSLIHMYGSCGAIELAKLVFDTMFVRDLVSWNSIIDGYVMVGDMSGAHAVFDEMPERNVVTWNVMISGFLKGRNPGYALKLFREMGKFGLKGNARTMVCVITACGRSGRVKEGRSVHGRIIRMFMRSSLILDTALIDMYCKCRRVGVGSSVFERMANKNLVSWNTMILGHCIHGSPEDGLNLFHVMVGKHDVEPHENPSVDRSAVRLLPDEVTFIGVICACARAELLIEGRSYFKQMTEVYNVKPNFAHFWCMANLLANVGLVEEAEEFLLNIAKFDGSMSYNLLLSAGLLGLCHFKRDVYLGERIAKLLIDMDPKNIACYQFLLVIYAVAAQWENVSRVQKLMKERKFGITPGSSLLDLKYIVHNFKMTTKQQEGIEVLNKMLDELANRLRLPNSDLGNLSMGLTENTS
ncbi:unnamed protein product [Lupinus luteus]|uniref:Pentatricopeptide repeat-containing protein n=1 Tax=Lupinus luteus TaxID=3873 RepID=A0AAV1YEF0_LUPLU